MTSRYVALLRIHVPLCAVTTILRLTSLMLCLFITMRECAIAQTDSRLPVADNDEEIVRIRTDLITVPVFVTDRRGRRITDLKQNDFVVRDEGQPVEISYFAASGQPVALVFALDASGSVRSVITQQRETALALFSRFGPDSRAAVLHFSDQAAFAVQFTSDANIVRQAFNFAALPDRRTAIFDAALVAVRAYDTQPRSLAERRIVLLLSDGLDTASTTRASVVIDEALASGVSIYVIHLPIFMPSNGRLVPRPPSKGFRELAKATGGRYFMVGNTQTALNPHAEYDLTAIFEAIAEEIQSQYLLGYYPSDATRDDRFRRIEVKLLRSDNRQLRIQTLREGYTLKAPKMLLQPTK